MTFPNLQTDLGVENNVPIICLHGFDMIKEK